MSVLATVFALGTRRRIAIFTALMVVGSMVLFVGPAAAHNPGCKIPGQGNGEVADSPHYPYDDDAKSQAFNHNPNLRDPVREKSLHPDHANSIHNIELSEEAGTVDAPRNSGKDCHN